MSIFNRKNSDSDSNRNEDNNLPSEDKSPQKMQEEEFVELYDAGGKPVRIPKKQWLQQVLPDQIKQKWNEPDALYNLIIQAIKDDFADAVSDAAHHLKEIDRIEERGSTVLAIVYMKTKQLDKAEQELLSYIQKNGKTGIILTNLAKIYFEQGKFDESENTLWEALCLDPNQENGLPWWVLRQKEKFGTNRVPEMLNKACEIKGSWLPQIYMAALFLEQKNLEPAMSLYKMVLPYAKSNNGVLYRISGDLGRFGYPKEAIHLIAPLYRPGKDDIRTGLNLVQSYYKLGMKREGLDLLDKLKQLQRMDIRPFITDMTSKFNSIEQGSGGEQKNLSNVKFILSMFDKPVWSYGLNSPDWLFPDKKNARKIGILSYSDLSPDKGELAEAVKEEDSGRLSRSLPLMLQESILFFTEYAPTVIIPVAAGIGPVVSKTNTANEQLKILADNNNCEIILTGSVCIDDGKYIIKTQIFNVKKNFFEQIECNANKEDFGLRVREHLIIAHEKLGAPLPKDESTKVGIYALPNAAIIKDYMVALSQSLVQTLAVKKMIDAKKIWGERNILNGCLKLASANPHNQILEAIFVSGLTKSKGYGSDIYKEYQRSVLALLRAGQSDAEKSQFLPLIYFTYMRSDEFEKCKNKAQANSDNPEYLEWIQRIESEKLDASK
jgi:tetratricopeptide (TPR) repeat protein